MPPDPQRDLAAFTDEELDALAEVSAEDIQRAQRTFRRDAAGTGYGGLLDAKPEEDDDASD